MNIQRLETAIEERRKFAKDLTKQKLHSSHQNLVSHIHLDKNRITSIRTITHKRKDEKEGWEPKLDVPRRIQSVKNLNRLQEKANLNIFSDLERNEFNIFKISDKRAHIRDWSLFASRQQKLASENCRQIHRRLLEKMKKRDKLKEELKSTNLKFYKLAQEVENLKVIMGNIGAQFQKNYIVLHSDPADI